jgi:hypothetical protein
MNVLQPIEEGLETLRRLHDLKSQIGKLPSCEFKTRLEKSLICIMECELPENLKEPRLKETVKSLQKDQPPKGFIELLPKEYLLLQKVGITISGPLFKTSRTEISVNGQATTIDSILSLS